MWQIFHRALVDSLQVFDTGFKKIVLTLVGLAVTALIVFLFRGWDKLKEHVMQNVLITFGGAVATWLLVFLVVLLHLPFKMLGESNANLITVIEEKRQFSMRINSQAEQLRKDREESARKTPIVHPAVALTPTVQYSQVQASTPSQAGNVPLTLYGRVQKTTGVIDRWKQDYAGKVEEIKSLANEHAAGIGTSIRSTQQDREQAEKVKDEEIKEGYMDLTFQANDWINQHKSDLTTLHQEAMSRMENARPDVWTPSAVEKDMKAFDTAIKSAEQGSSLSDLNKQHINPKRFDALSTYFSDLIKQLSEFPDT
jgi:hypothetical protein